MSLLNRMKQSKAPSERSKKTGRRRRPVTDDGSFRSGRSKAARQPALHTRLAHSASQPPFHAVSGVNLRVATLPDGSKIRYLPRRGQLPLVSRQHVPESLRHIAAFSGSEIAPPVVLQWLQDAARLRLSMLVVAGGDTLDAGRWLARLLAEHRYDGDRLALIADTDPGIFDHHDAIHIARQKVGTMHTLYEILYRFQVDCAWFETLPLDDIDTLIDCGLMTALYTAVRASTGEAAVDQLGYVCDHPGWLAYAFDYVIELVRSSDDKLHIKRISTLETDGSAGALPRVQPLWEAGFGHLLPAATQKVREQKALLHPIVPAEHPQQSFSGQALCIHRDGRSTLESLAAPVEFYVQSQNARQIYMQGRQTLIDQLAPGDETGFASSNGSSTPHITALSGEMACYDDAILIQDIHLLKDAGVLRLVEGLFNGQSVLLNGLPGLYHSCLLATLRHHLQQARVTLRRCESIADFQEASLYAPSDWIPCVRVTGFNRQFIDRLAQYESPVVLELALRPGVPADIATRFLPDAGLQYERVGRTIQRQHTVVPAVHPSA